MPIFLLEMQSTVPQALAECIRQECYAVVLQLVASALYPDIAYQQLNLKARLVELCLYKRGMRRWVLLQLSFLQDH